MKLSMKALLVLTLLLSICTEGRRGAPPPRGGGGGSFNAALAANRAGNDEEETDLGDGVTSVKFTAVHPPPASAQELNRVLKEAASRCATTLRCPLVTNELQEAAIGTGSSASRQASFNAGYHAGLHSLDQVETVLGSSRSASTGFLLASFNAGYQAGVKEAKRMHRGSAPSKRTVPLVHQPSKPNHTAPTIEKDKNRKKTANPFVALQTKCCPKNQLVCLDSQLKTDFENCTHHPGLTGPLFPNLKDSDGTPVSPTWYEGYQVPVTPKWQQDVEFPDGSIGNCNLARCDNPPVCKIPACRSVSQAECRNKAAERFVGATISDVEACAAVSTSSTNPWLSTNTSNHSLVFELGLPGSRMGTVRPANTTANRLSCFPTVAPEASGYVQPSQLYCNPLGWESCTKAGIVALPGNHGTWRNFGLLFVKRTVCINGRPNLDSFMTAINKGEVSKACDKFAAQQSSKRCHSHKLGTCVQFTPRPDQSGSDDVFEKYQKSNTPSNVNDAYHRLADGFTTTCSKEAIKLANSILISL